MSFKNTQDHKTSFYPDGRVRENPSRRAKNKFTEFEEAFPFDAKTMKDTRFLRNAKGEFIGLDTVSLEHQSSNDRRTWYPCPLRNPLERDIFVPTNRRILMDWFCKFTIGKVLIIYNYN